MKIKSQYGKVINSLKEYNPQLKVLDIPPPLSWFC